MKIRTKFIIIGFLALVVATVFGGFVFYSNFTATKVEAREATAQELVIVVFERNLLLSDYLLNRSERAKEQVLAQNKEIESTLLEAFFVFDDTDSIDVLAQIQKNYDNITFDLKRLFTSGETPGSIGSLADSQSVSRILTKSQSTVDLASQVASNSRAQLIQLRQGSVVSVGIFSIGGVLFAIVAMLIIVSTTRKLTVLEKSAVNIAKGKFAERVNIKSKDEVGMVARSFNAMAENLQGSYAQLEQKVAGRTKDLSKNVAELEKVKSATLNILEDLQQEKKETAKFQQAVEGATEAVMMTSPDQKIMYYNKACEKLGGYEKEEALGRNASELFVSEKTPKKVVERMQKTIQAGKSFHTEEFVLRRKDGSTVETELSIFPILQEQKVQFFVGLLQDITRRKEVSRMESEFISTASHQLRTPMTGIQWIVERFMRKEKVSKRGKEYLSDIHVSIKRLTALVDLLLNVSRIEGGRVGISPQPLELIGFIKGYARECRPLIVEKNLNFIFKEHPKELQVVTDSSALRNVVQSIVSNAIEYTPQNGIIEVAIEAEQKKGTFLLSVQDSGIGIPKESQETIFHKFTRADNAKLVKTDGTGLGLYIAKQAVELLGGKIWLESEVNKGTTFFVELPVQSKPKGGEKTLTNA
jgi:PAS domain S-box-containing protein